MGEQLARKIKAVKYLECSSFDGTDILVEKVFEEDVRFTIRRFEEGRKTLIQNKKGFLKRFFFKLVLTLQIVLYKFYIYSTKIKILLLARSMLFLKITKK